MPINFADDIPQIYEDAVELLRQSPTFNDIAGSSRYDGILISAEQTYFGGAPAWSGVLPGTNVWQANVHPNSGSDSLLALGSMARCL